MQIFYNLSTIFISTFAVFGVMIHGAHLNQIASSSGAAQIYRTSDSGSSNAGTHIDSSSHPHAEFQASSLFRYLEHNSAHNTPMDRGRSKSATQKSPANRGRHPFDNAFLPMIS